MGKFGIDFCLKHASFLDGFQGVISIELGEFVSAFIDCRSELLSVGGTFCVVDLGNEMNQAILRKLQIDSQIANISVLDGTTIDFPVKFVGVCETVKFVKCAVLDPEFRYEKIYEANFSTNLFHARGVSTCSGHSVEFSVSVYLLDPKIRKIAVTQRIVPMDPVPSVNIIIPTPVISCEQYIQLPIPFSEAKSPLPEVVISSDDESILMESDEDDVTISDILPIRQQMDISFEDVSFEQPAEEAPKPSKITQPKPLVKKREAINYEMKVRHQAGKVPNYMLDTNASSVRQFYDIKYLRVYGNLDKPKTKLTEKREAKSKPTSASRVASKNGSSISRKNVVEKKENQRKQAAVGNVIAVASETIFDSVSKMEQTFEQLLPCPLDTDDIDDIQRSENELSDMNTFPQFVVPRFSAVTATVVNT